MSNYYDDNPCEDFERAYFCDWEARFCCTRCHYVFGEDTPCEDCDPMDI